MYTFINIVIIIYNCFDETTVESPDLEISENMFFFLRFTIKLRTPSPQTCLFGIYAHVFTVARKQFASK